MLREYIVSEAMAALGIPTTRALAVVTTGETVWRETPLPGAVLTRVASSRVRVGTFQFFAARGDVDAIRRLADHVIARHYPEALDAANPYRTLLNSVISRQAELVAKWLLVGFIHGVMNTDNMSIAGETIDYGPCAFMDVYHAGTVYSSIDTVGRYAYGNQPAIARWNLVRSRKRSYRCLQRTRTPPWQRRKRQSMRSPLALRRPTPRVRCARMRTRFCSVHDLILLCVLLCVEDAKSYAERFTLERIVKTQSGHVPVPIAIIDKPGAEPSEVADGAALWAKRKSEVSPADYTDFY